ncbi:hypothetical protein KOW79_016240 [Hemibagrus wyckioides]|uniref:Uncharacterized protein n=1 Tax=Hemibagrus wyckioides TaxID=337641 RepID=A0A9D3NGH6_9TELE|nr:hypothetical protein KOW79_016240 [Hemibagrus wyckioides]
MARKGKGRTVFIVADSKPRASVSVEDEQHFTPLCPAFALSTTKKKDGSLCGITHPLGFGTRLHQKQLYSKENQFRGPSIKVLAGLKSQAISLRPSSGEISNGFHPINRFPVLTSHQ